MRLKKAYLFFGFFLIAGTIVAQRVVSMAPAVTEIVFALGKGDLLVGVSQFCDYPAQARAIAKVGGLFDVNMEALLALAPEIVIAYPEQYAQVQFLETRARVLVVKHECLSDLFAAIVAIGNALHAEGEAESMVLALKRKFAAIKARAKGRKTMRVLIIAGRNPDELKNMYIIGNRDFLNELLEIAGGVNAYRGTIRYPSISMETVVFLNPDVIIELSAHYEGIGDERIHELWQPFTMLAAVQNRRLQIIKETFWLRPGPRVNMIAEALARLFASAAGEKEPSTPADS
ncbi:MAG: helical backbone metal receptor [Candidatus Aminicenantes bacterium]|nr:helical backbone metal receptor [Candidatus Aminicenantes bacterium]